MSFTFTHTFPIAASVPRVFAALTTGDALAIWFAQHVRIEPRVGGAFAFWGKHTLDGAGDGAGLQILTSFTPDEALAFSWRIAGVPTQVAIALQANADETKLTVTHQVDGELPWPRQRDAIDDWWRLSAGNLITHLLGTGALVRVDFSDPAPEVKQIVDIAAPPSVVFHALTDPALVTQWFGAPSPVIEPRRGGRYVLGWAYKVDGRDVQGGPTTILAYEQDRLLVLDWPDWRGDPSNGGQRITFRLEPIATGTRLTFVHDGFARPVDISDYGFGWLAFLGNLATIAAAPVQ